MGDPLGHAVVHFIIFQSEVQSDPIITQIFVCGLKISRSKKGRIHINDLSIF